MIVNPPPARCDGCGRVTINPAPNAPAAGDPQAWVRLDGPDVSVVLDGGRNTARRGHGWVCRTCGHTVQLSRERPTWAPTTGGD